MIACDVCDDWFHFGCVNVPNKQRKSIKTFVCPGVRAVARLDVSTPYSSTRPHSQSFHVFSAVPLP